MCFFSKGSELSNKCVSRSVEICKICNLDWYFFAKETANDDERKQASSLRINGCASMGMSSPYCSLKRAMLVLTVNSSSQCVAISIETREKRLSKTASLSTNMFPVDEPIKIFIPQIFWWFVFNTSSRLSLEAPMKKE